MCFGVEEKEFFAKGKSIKFQLIDYHNKSGCDGVLGFWGFGDEISTKNHI